MAQFKFNKGYQCADFQSETNQWLGSEIAFCFLSTPSHLKRKREKNKTQRPCSPCRNGPILTCLTIVLFKDIQESSMNKTILKRIWVAFLWLYYVSEEYLIDKWMKINVNLNRAEKLQCQLKISHYYCVLGVPNLSGVLIYPINSIFTLVYIQIYY